MQALSVPVFPPFGQAPGLPWIHKSASLEGPLANSLGPLWASPNQLDVLELGLEQIR